MKERPIIISRELIKPILLNVKTHTRLVLKPQPQENGAVVLPSTCPYGEKGDRLWVKETWCVESSAIERKEDTNFILYRADMSVNEASNFKWCSSLLMPRWASRITLEILNWRIERLQDISFEDCLKEGIMHTRFWNGFEINKRQEKYVREVFKKLWNSIHTRSGYDWDSNPWVWVIEFRRLTP